MTLSLYRHQTLASMMLDEVDSLALFYEQGTGKTMCILDWIERHCEEDDLPQGSVLILCPASAVQSWQRAIDRLADFGHPSEAVARVRQAVVITSYGRIYQSRKDKATGRMIHALKPEYLHTWALIAVDESHSIGAHDSVRTRMCLDLAQHAQKRAILTGTPVSGGGGGRDYQKLYGQMLFLDYGAFEGMRGKKDPWCTWTQWKNRYITLEDYFGRPMQYDEDALMAVMKRYALVARLDECYDMPDSEDIDLTVTLSAPASSYYRKLERFDPVLTDDCTVEINTGGQRYIKMYEITSGFVKRTSSDASPLTFPTSRLDALDNIIQGTDDKVVVFCHFSHSVRQAAELCRRYGETVVMDGQSPSDSWLGFQDGSAHYIVCQYQSGGVAIDLFASHTCVYYEPTMSTLLLDQSRARIRRKGQTKHCLYYYITTDHGVDKRISDTVRSGVDVTNEMLEMWDKEDRKKQKG